MIALVTGANRGIGAALVAALAARGETVIGTARDPSPGSDLVRCDVTDPQSVFELPMALAGRPLDLLVCNAGVYLDRGHELDNGYPAELWARTLAVNVTGVFLTVQALLPALRAARGKIAVISSQMASQTNAPGGAYAYRASKAAALNLGRNLAADLAGDGIAVGIYHPGSVRTAMGGPNSTLDPDQSAAGLLARFDVLGLATTGCFETWDGRPHPF